MTHYMQPVGLTTHLDISKDSYMRTSTHRGSLRTMVQEPQVVMSKAVLEAAERVANELRALQDEYILMNFKDGVPAASKQMNQSWGQLVMFDSLFNHLQDDVMADAEKVTKKRGKPITVDMKRSLFDAKAGKPWQQALIANKMSKAADRSRRAADQARRENASYVIQTCWKHYRVRKAFTVDLKMKWAVLKKDTDVRLYQRALEDLSRQRQMAVRHTLRTRKGGWEGMSDLPFDMEVSASDDAGEEEAEEEDGRLQGQDSYDPNNVANLFKDFAARTSSGDYSDEDDEHKRRGRTLESIKSRKIVPMKSKRDFEFHMVKGPDERKKTKKVTQVNVKKRLEELAKPMKKRGEDRADPQQWSKVRAAGQINTATRRRAGAEALSVGGQGVKTHSAKCLDDMVRKTKMLQSAVSNFKKLDDVLQEWVEGHRDKLNGILQTGSLSELDSLDEQLLADLDEKHATGQFLITVSAMWKSLKKGLISARDALDNMPLSDKKMEEIIGGQAGAAEGGLGSGGSQQSSQQVSPEMRRMITARRKSLAYLDKTDDTKMWAQISKSISSSSVVLGKVDPFILVQRSMNKVKMAKRRMGIPDSTRKLPIYVTEDNNSLYRQPSTPLPINALTRQASAYDRINDSPLGLSRGWSGPMPVEDIISPPLVRGIVRASTRQPPSHPADARGHPEPSRETQDEMHHHDGHVHFVIGAADEVAQPASKDRSALGHAELPQTLEAQQQAGPSGAPLELTGGQAPPQLQQSPQLSAHAEAAGDANELTEAGRPQPAAQEMDGPRHGIAQAAAATGDAPGPGQVHVSLGRRPEPEPEQQTGGTGRVDAEALPAGDQSSGVATQGLTTAEQTVGSPATASGAVADEAPAALQPQPQAPVPSTHATAPDLSSETSTLLRDPAGSVSVPAGAESPRVTDHRTPRGTATSAPPEAFGAHSTGGVGLQGQLHPPGAAAASSSSHSVAAAQRAPDSDSSRAVPGRAVTQKAVTGAAAPPKGGQPTIAVPSAAAAPRLDDLGPWAPSEDDNRSLPAMSPKQDIAAVTDGGSEGSGPQLALKAPSAASEGPKASAHQPQLPAEVLTGRPAAVAMVTPKEVVADVAATAIGHHSPETSAKSARPDALGAPSSLSVPAEAEMLESPSLPESSTEHLTIALPAVEVAPVLPTTSSSTSAATAAASASSTSGLEAVRAVAATSTIATAATATTTTTTKATTAAAATAATTIATTTASSSSLAESTRAVSSTSASSTVVTLAPFAPQRGHQVEMSPPQPPGRSPVDPRARRRPADSGAMAEPSTVEASPPAAAGVHSMAADSQMSVASEPSMELYLLPEDPRRSTKPSPRHVDGSGGAVRLDKGGGWLSPSQEPPQPPSGELPELRQAPVPPTSVVSHLLPGDPLFTSNEGSHRPENIRIPNAAPNVSCMSPQESSAVSSSGSQRPTISPLEQPGQPATAANMTPSGRPALSPRELVARPTSQSNGRMPRLSTIGGSPMLLTELAQQIETVAVQGASMPWGSDRALSLWGPSLQQKEEVLGQEATDNLQRQAFLSNIKLRAETLESRSVSDKGGFKRQSATQGSDPRVGRWASEGHGVPMRPLTVGGRLTPDSEASPEASHESNTVPLRSSSPTGMLAAPARSSVPEAAAASPAASRTSFRTFQVPTEGGDGFLPRLSHPISAYPPYSPEATRRSRQGAVGTTRKAPGIDNTRRASLDAVRSSWGSPEDPRPSRLSGGSSLRMSGPAPRGPRATRWSVEAVPPSQAAYDNVKAEGVYSDMLVGSCPVPLGRAPAGRRGPPPALATAALPWSPAAGMQPSPSSPARSPAAQRGKQGSRGARISLGISTPTLDIPSY